MAPPIATQPASGLALNLATLFKPGYLADKTPEETATALALAIDDLLDSKLQERERLAAREVLLTSKEAGKMLDISPVYVQQLAKDGRLRTHRKPGRRFHYFKVGELEDWRLANLKDSGQLKRVRRGFEQGIKQKAGK